MATPRQALVGIVALTAALAGCSATPAATSTIPPPPAPSSSATPAATSPPAAEASSSGKCLLADLRSAVGRTTGDVGQRHTTVVWTNTSSSACTMFGYGGVDLKGPPDPHLITPPDETHSAILDWPGGAVVRQDGATHPGTYLGPVQAGADA